MLSVIAFPLLLLFEPNPKSFILLIIVMIVQYATLASVSVAPYAMLGDVIDYDRLKTGKTRSAQYISILTLLMKSVGAVGSGIGFFILKFFHYDAAATVHDASSVFGIQFAVGWSPAIFVFLSAIASWTFPIDERRQRIIQRRIESLEKRAQHLENQEAEKEDLDLGPGSLNSEV